MSATPPDTPHAPQRLTAEERTETLTEVKRQAQALFERTEVKRSEFMNLGKAHKEELIAAMAVEAQLRRARDLALQRGEKTRAEREAAELQTADAEARLGQLRAQLARTVQSLADTEAQLQQREAAGARAPETAPLAVAASKPGVTQSLRTLAESYKPDAEADAALDFDLGLPMPKDELRKTEADLSAERSKVAIAAKQLEQAVRARLVTEQRAKAAAKQQATLEAEIDKATTAKIMLGAELEREEGRRKEVQGLLEAEQSARVEIDLRLTEAAAEQVRLKREAEVARARVESARTETESARTAAARAEEELKQSKTRALSTRAELAGRQREDEALKHELADMLARVASFEADLKRERIALAAVETDLAAVRERRQAAASNLTAEERQTEDTARALAALGTRMSEHQGVVEATEKALQQLGQRALVVEAAQRQREAQLALAAEQNATLMQQVRELMAARTEKLSQAEALNVELEQLESKVAGTRAALARERETARVGEEAAQTERAGHQRAEAEIAALRQELAEVGQRQAAVRTEHAEQKRTLEAAEQQLRDEQAALRSGSAQMRAALEHARAARQDNEAAAADERIAGARARAGLAEVHAALLIVTGQRAAAGHDLANAQAERDALRAQLTAAATSAEQALQVWQVRQRESEQLDQSVAREHEARAHLETILRLSRSERSALEVDAKAARLSEARLRANLAEAKASAEQANTALRALPVLDTTALAADHAAALAQMQALKRRIAQGQEEIAAAEARLQEQPLRRAELEAQCRSAESELEQAKIKLAQTDAEQQKIASVHAERVDRMAIEMQRLAGEMAAAEQERTAVVAAHDAAQEALASVRSAVNLEQLQRDAEEEAATHKRLQQDLEDARARGAAALAALNREHAAQAAAQAAAQTAARLASEQSAREQAQQVERDAAKIEAASQAALARTAAARGELAQREQDASAAEDAVSHAAQRLSAARECVAFETAAFEEATREAAARKLDRQNLTADDSRLTGLESEREAVAGRSPPAPAASGKRAHWGWFGLGGTFVAMAMAMYVVPRMWPEQTARFAPALVQAPATAAVPARAAPSSQVVLTPLYAPDASAQRDLVLSYELKSIPKEKP